MPSIVVLGAGPIGAATAFALASRDAARRIVLVDAAEAAARGLALDMQQAGAVTGSSSRIDGTSDMAAVIGADVIVLADRLGAGGAWTGDQGLSLLAAARGLNRRAMVLCADAAAADLIQKLVLERDADRRLVAGTAPEALRQGVRALTALAAHVAADDVEVTVVGRPPRDLFPAWSGASIGGSPAVDVLSPPDVTRLDAQASRLWPPGPLALGTAAALVAHRVLAATPGLMSLLIVPPRDADVRDVCVCVPAVCGLDGLTPRWPVLATRDRVRLNAASRA